MTNVVISVGEAANGSYPVSLHRDDHDDWLQQPEATAEIPESLDSTEPPRIDDEPASPASISQFVLSQQDPSGLFREIGEYLYGLLLSGEMQAAWQDARGSAQLERVVLDVQARRLAQLPWELLCDRGEFLFLEQRYALLRGPLDWTGPSPDPADFVPLRVLVVVGCADRIPMEREERRAIALAMRKFKGGAELDFLVEPSRLQLQTTCGEMQPHVLHLIGHGWLKVRQGREEAVVGMGCSDRLWEFTAGDVMNHVSARPRLVVLNACRSQAGNAEEDAKRAMADLTTAFKDSGSVATIAMQGDIGGRQAAVFAGTLYAALADHRPIDQAVATARSKVYGQGTDRRDWFLPSLNLHVPPEHVLPLREIDEERRHRVVTIFERLADFVNRTEERRRLGHGIDPVGGTEPRRVMFVTGMSEVGKTWVVEWLRGRCLLRGRQVWHVDFEGGSHDLLRTLQIILTDPDGGDQVRATALRRFNQQRAVLQGEDVPRDQSELSVGPHNVWRIVPGPEGLLSDLMQAFRATVRDAAGAEPLIMLFDHFGNVDESYARTVLWPQFVERVGWGDLSQVRLVVAAEKGELAKRSQREIRPEETLALQPIDPKEFAWLALEYLEGRETPITEELRDLIPLWVAQAMHPPLLPSRLADLARNIGGP